ncbi:MAG: glycosyltransferase family 4 protein [Candidatus Pristimantibacillus sp.]
MRIGIDMFYAQSPSVFHGIGNYSFHHLSHLAEEPNVEMFFFQPIYSTLNREAYIAELTRFIIDNQLDVFHFPSPMEAPYPDVIASEFLPPVYLTAMVFDLIPFIFPERYLPSEESRIHYEKLMALLRRMDLLLTISEYTRSDMIKFGFDPNKVFLSGFGRDEGYYVLDEAELSDMAHLFPIEKPFILAFTPSDFRKNTNRLLGAFSTALDRTKADVHLLFLNVRNEVHLNQLIAEYGLTGRAHSGGRVTKPQLLRLYNKALALAFPSLYEGIGLPVLEAMQCGLPVLSSNTSSLPEVVGNEAIVVDPYNEAAIAEGLVELIQSDTLREDLRRRGLIRTQLFDWRDTAHRTVEALLQLHRSDSQKIIELPREAAPSAIPEPVVPESEESVAVARKRRKKRRNKIKRIKKRRRLRLRRRKGAKGKSQFKARRMQRNKRGVKRTTPRSTKIKRRRKRKRKSHSKRRSG